MRLTAAQLPLAFGVFGVLWGAWQAVLPDLAADRQLSSGPLGAILTLGFVASFPAMIGAGRLVDRVGAGWGIAVSAIAMAAALLAIGTLPSLPMLVAGFVLFAAAAARMTSPSMARPWATKRGAARPG